jgi:hypothetical protein
MSRIISVDFTGVEVGGGRVRIPEGDYGFEITQVKGKKGEESQKNYLLISFKAIQGDKRGLNKVLVHSCSLQKQSLWNLRNLLEACGKQTPAKAIKLDLDKMSGLKCAGTVIDDEYEGKKKSVITAFFPLADLGNTSETGDELEEAVEEDEEEATEEVEEEEKPAKKTEKKKAVKKKEEPAEEEETTEEGEEDLFS